MPTTGMVRVIDVYDLPEWEGGLPGGAVVTRRDPGVVRGAYWHLDMLGRRLRLAREYVRLTRAKAAKLAGCGETTVESYEHGRTTPDLSRLVRLANVYGVSIPYLLSLRDAT